MEELSFQADYELEENDVRGFTMNFGPQHRSTRGVKVSFRA